MSWTAQGIWRALAHAPFKVSACVGGTGFSYLCLLVEHLSDDCEKKSKLSGNGGRYLHSLLEHGDLTVGDNEALRGICRRHWDIEYPTRTDRNRSLAQFNLFVDGIFSSSGAMV